MISVCTVFVHFIYLHASVNLWICADNIEDQTGTHKCVVCSGAKKPCTKQGLTDCPYIDPLHACTDVSWSFAEVNISTSQLFVCLFVTGLSLCSVRINWFSYLAILEAWSIKKERKYNKVAGYALKKMFSDMAIYGWQTGRKVCSLSINRDSAGLLASRSGTSLVHN